MNSFWFGWVWWEKSGVEHLMSKLLLIDSFNMLGIRLSQLYIHDVHDHTVLMTISLCILVEFWCSSIFWKICCVLDEERRPGWVWSICFNFLFELVFGAISGQSERSTACNWNYAVLAWRFSITKMPLVHNY